VEMGGRCRFVTVAVQAVHRSVVGVHDHHLHRGAGGRGWVDVPGGVMTGGATTEVGGQDVRPVQDRVAVGTRLRIGLAAVGGLVDLYAMVDQTAG